MAAPMAWRKHFNQHPIFHHLRQISKSSGPVTENKSLIEVKDGQVFIWASSDAQLLTTNLKTLVRKPHTAHSDQPAPPVGDNSHFSEPQRLLCTASPLHQVSSIIFNGIGTHVALVGKTGVSVLELPQRWGKNADFEGGKEKILCRTISVAERFFCTSGEKLLHAAWHPGSTSDSHLVVLTSDNCIRVYDIHEPQKPLQEYSLKEGGNDPSASPSKMNFDAALGETAVSFDFGPPVDLHVKKRIGVKHGDADATPKYVWPLYVLWGNGNVYHVTTSLDAKYPLSRQLQGPLAMYPPAEDNYGTDACSLIVLPSRPPVLALATCEGKLHHCVVLHCGQEDAQESEPGSPSTTGPLYEKVPESKLYVFETVKLEFSLTTIALETDEPILDEYTCPVRLHKDSSCPDLYHCSHSAGIHTISLPWLHRIQQFCEQEDGINLPALGPTHQSINEHRMCTKPSSTSAASPVQGLCIVDDRLLGTALLCLTSESDCLVFSLSDTHHTSPPPSLLDTAPTAEIKSPLRKMRSESLDQHIRKILQRNSSVPVLKQKDDQDPQECFQLLSRITQVLREEYLQKQELAREEIEKRARLLREQKEWQEKDLQLMQQERNIRTEAARNLAERYEEANENQQQLLHRVETILKKLQSRLPMLSDAEKNMQTELQGIAEQVKMFKANIQQLSIKQDYQSRQIRQRQSASGSSASGSPGNLSPFNKTQVQHLRKVLTQEGDDIAELVQKVNVLEVNVDT